MRVPAPIRLLLGLAVLFATTAWALNVSVKTLQGKEGGVFNSAYIEANGERFALVLPNGWQTRIGANPNSLSLNSRSGESPISIEFSTQDAKPLLASTDHMRQAVASFLKDATMSGEFEAHSAYNSGRGMDLKFELQGIQMICRTIVIPLKSGFVSFQMTSSAEAAGNYQQILGAAVATFRSAPANVETDSATVVQPFASERIERPVARVAFATQQFEELHTEPPPSVDNSASAEKPLFAGHEQLVLLSVVFILTGILTSWGVARHKREAEIRALCGGYLSDGTEVARFKMPEWFAPQGLGGMPAPTASGPDWLADPSPVKAGKSLVERFLEEAPGHLIQIRKVLRALGRSGNEAEWQTALAELPQHITKLKDQANFWEMRPVWQMSSALELLVNRVAERPKDATPSTLRTISAAFDLLQKLCAPDIRPNLIIDPPIQVLAVDDDPLCLRALTFALQKANLNADTASNGVQALAQASERVYDVIFMDIQMPVMDGLTACKRIREMEANADTPVVFVTIQSDFHTRAQSIVLGGSDLMAKPFLVFELAVKALTVAMRKRLQGSNTVKRPMPALARASLPSESNLAPIISSASAAGETQLADVPTEAAMAKNVLGDSEVEHGFLQEAHGFLVTMRSMLADVEHAPDETLRQKLLGDLYIRAHSFATDATSNGLPLAGRVSFALEALVKKLHEKPGQVTASTRATIASALDLLEELRIPGRRQKLVDNSPVHLLVVDDEPLARRAIAGALQLAFDKPDSAVDGSAALALAAQKSYDVIFTDIQMPGLDGFALCRELRATEKNQTTPVIFITGLGDDASRDQAAKSGGSDFIAKPCLPSEIALKALTFLLRKRLNLPPAPASFGPADASTAGSKKAREVELVAS